METGFDGKNAAILHGIAMITIKNSRLLINPGPEVSDPAKRPK